MGWKSIPHHKLKPCRHCGGKGELCAVQVAEDSVETWVRCTKCGSETDRIEDAYADRPTAAWHWNRGDALQPNTERKGGE